LLRHVPEKFVYSCHVSLSVKEHNQATVIDSAQADCVILLQREIRTEELLVSRTRRDGARLALQQYSKRRAARNTFMSWDLPGVSIKVRKKVVDGSLLVLLK